MPPRPPLYTLTTSRRQTVWDKGLAWLPLGAETCRRCRVHKSPLRDSAEHKSQMATLACGVQMHMQGPETPTTIEVRFAPRTGTGLAKAHYSAPERPRWKAAKPKEGRVSLRDRQRPDIIPTPHHSFHAGAVL